ncbi:hypothetical protein K438DRAFT_411513 [Mycena galopus ATCC 62051]|nr:hypothetical protein K438DRAFT_411513 [Mycena galopus ATCC 62051]
MKLENLRLRHRLSDVESQLLQLETDSSNRRSSGRLKEERQRRLIKEKLTIQESLRLIIYPILTIPVELTSEIFLHCLLESEVDAQLSTSLAPLLLGQICRMWRDIAYTNPRLWAALEISSWGGDGFRCLVQDWLRRAGSVPLSLNLTLPHDSCQYFTEPSVCDVCPSSSLFADHWSHLTSFCGHNFSVADCIALLVLTPRLIRCELFSVYSLEPSPVDATRIVLCDLEDLTLTSLNAGCLFLLLDSLTLIKLVSLGLDCSFRLFPDILFLSFLQRAPAIHTFSIRSNSWSPRDGIITILSAMPTLSSFELRLFASSTAFDILRLLNRSATFLPHLQKLLFSVENMVSWEDHYTPILLEALSSRWETKSGVTRLVEFQFLFPKRAVGSDAKLSDGVLKLREKGMRIEVSGT